MTDLTTVRCGAIAFAAVADARCKELDAAVDRLLAAREAANAALARANEACAFAERMVRLAGRAMGGDVAPEHLAEVAAELRELFGPELTAASQHARERAA